MDLRALEAMGVSAKPLRPGELALGTVTEAVPVTRSVANFSSMPRIVPPPLGSDSVGATGTALAALPDRDLLPASAASPSVACRESLPP